MQTNYARRLFLYIVALICLCPNKCLPWHSNRCRYGTDARIIPIRDSAQNFKRNADLGPKKFLKRYFAGRDHSKSLKRFGWLGDHLHSRDLWHFSRRSVAGGVSLGFFLAFIPIPIQMLLAVPASIVLSVNLPIAMIALWISNPVTMAPLFIFAYKVGAWATNQPSELATLMFEPTFAGLAEKLGEIWWPLSVGCVICGLGAAAIGNLCVRWLWRMVLLRSRKKGRQDRLRPSPEDRAINRRRD